MSELTSKPSTDWGVVITALEPAELVVAFAAHYVSLGAREVHIYLDQDGPRAVKWLGRIPGVIVTVADDVHYLARFGTPRPEGHMRRQRLNAWHAYQVSRAAWLLHVDADEFLLPGPLEAELAALPDSIEGLVIPNGERAYVAGAAQQTVFDGVMRRHYAGPEELIDDFLGQEMHRFTDRGFSGHALGKCITRTGRKLKPGLHAPRRGQGARLFVSRVSEICHFDGLTPRHWMAKLQRYLDTGFYDKARPGGAHRTQQVRQLRAAAGSDEALDALHTRTKVVTPDQVDRLSALGLLAPVPAQIATAAARYFSSEELDLSPACFDRQLVPAHPATAAPATG